MSVQVSPRILPDDAAGELTGGDNQRGQTTYGYDDAGNRTSLDDSKGGLTSYAYDARNELTSLSQSGSGVNSKLVEYTYDNAGDMTPWTATPTCACAECGRPSASPGGSPR